jgi:hypothetical protein
VPTTLDSSGSADRLLDALGEQLAARATSFDLVVIGGAALLALGLVDRPTKDVDIVGLLREGGLEAARPLPGVLDEARAVVARDFGLREHWLNGGPTSLLDLGMPEGFLERATTRTYGAYLTVRFASRFDQIHFKLYAMVDAGGPGKHEQDLRELHPGREELLAAARWTLTHDPSAGYLEALERALAYLGVEDADLSAR